MHRTARRLQPLSSWGPPAVHAAKMAAASGVSWFIAANLIGNHIPVFAPLAAVLTVQLTVWESVSRGLQRVLGVVVGVLVAYGFARLAGINAWSIALIIFVALLAGRALRLGAQGSIQVPVSALLVLVLGATTSGYAVDRVVDTAIGAALGSLVNLIIVPRTHLGEAQAEVRRFAGALASLLRDVARSPLRAPDPSVYLDRARRLSDEAATTAAAVQRTETATRWNPRGRRDRPATEKLQGAVRVLAVVERPVRGIARSIADAPEGWSPPPELTGPLNELLVRVADGLDAWAADSTSAADATSAAGATSATPADEPAQLPGPQDQISRPVPSIAALYRSVLAATRLPGIGAETAAIASAIALDANRISDELQSVPEPLPVARFNWQTLFG